MKIIDLGIQESRVTSTIRLNWHFIIDVVDKLSKEYEPCFDIESFDWKDRSQQLTLPLCDIRKFNYSHYGNIVNLLHTIPIYLRIDKPDECGEDDVVERLGAYFPNHKNDNPYIELYAYRIWGDTDYDRKKFIWLFTIVLIHELAHASMDVYNEEGFSGTPKIHYSSEFGRRLEEYVANIITLHTIKLYGDENFYSYAETLIEKQDSVSVLCMKNNWIPPYAFDSVISAKKYGVDDNLQQKWLEYVKGNPTPDGLFRFDQILSSQIRYEYNGIYETDISDIELVVVLDYIRQKGNVSLDELYSAFPYLEACWKLVPYPLNKDEDERHCYLKPDEILHLTDGDFAMRMGHCLGVENDFVEEARNNGFAISVFMNFDNDNK